MSGEIVNRVEKSGLMTIDLDEIKLPSNIFEIDIKKWLFEGLFLKEKEFRNNINKHDWSAYTDAYVYVHCSSFSCRFCPDPIPPCFQVQPL